MESKRLLIKRYYLSKYYQPRYENKFKQIRNRDRYEILNKLLALVINLLFIKNTINEFFFYNKIRDYYTI